MVQAPCTQAGCAFGTFVVHASPQAPQLLVSVDMSTHAPPQRVLALAGHPEAQEYDPPSTAAAQTGVPPSGAHVTPQAPQLDDVVSWTHAPLQGLLPAEQLNVQLPLTHAGCELATLLAHAIPQPPQLSGSLVMSTQVPEHSVGAAAGQPETQEYDPFDPAHTAMPPSPVHAFPQLPQLAAVVYWTHAPLHNL